MTYYGNNMLDTIILNGIHKLTLGSTAHARPYTYVPRISNTNVMKIEHQSWKNAVFRY